MMSDLIAIPVAMVAIIPLRMAAIPGAGMVIGSPVGRISVCLPAVMTIVIMAIADREAETAGLDFDMGAVSLGACRHGREGEADQRGRSDRGFEGCVHL